jgi:hypothetical protein
MRVRWFGVVCVAVGVATATAGCERADTSPPTRLMDGSRPAVLLVDLEGIVKAPVRTSVTVTRLEKIKATSAISTCVRRAATDRPDGPIVVRVGVQGESVTFRNGSGTGLYGCDNSAGPGEGDRHWCGGAFGELRDGRLRDPRLDMGDCVTGESKPLGFAWIEPGPQTRFVVVSQSNYAEVYETARGLPVRVTTDDVEIERSRASFDVSEHAADGSLIRKYRVEPSVAG